MQKKPIGASDVKQSPRSAKLSDELYGSCKLTAKDVFRADIIRVAVRTLPGKIVAGIIALRLESHRLSSPETALLTTQDVAAVLPVEKSMDARLATSQTHVRTISDP